LKIPNLFGWEVFDDVSVENICAQDSVEMNENENSTAPTNGNTTTSSQVTVNSLSGTSGTHTNEKENGGGGNEKQLSVKNIDEKKLKEMEMAKEYQKVTRSLAREISKKDGFSLVTQTDESKTEPAKAVPVSPIPEEPVEPTDGFLTETTFQSATSLLLALEV
jgi:hypothetical protein